MNYLLKLEIVKELDKEGLSTERIATILQIPLELVQKQTEASQEYQV